MNYNIDDKVLIRLNPDQLGDPILSQADGLTGTIVEVYQNLYDPEVDRFSIDLDEAIEGADGSPLLNIEGLYEDNLEPIKRTAISESIVFTFDQFESKKN